MNKLEAQINEIEVTRTFTVFLTYWRKLFNTGCIPNSYLTSGGHHIHELLNEWSSNQLKLKLAIQSTLIGSRFASRVSISVFLIDLSSIKDSMIC